MTMTPFTQATQGIKTVSANRSKLR